MSEFKISGGTYLPPDLLEDNQGFYIPVNHQLVITGQLTMLGGSELDIEGILAVV